MLSYVLFITKRIQRETSKKIIMYSSLFKISKCSRSLREYNSYINGIVNIVLLLIFIYFKRIFKKNT